LVTDWRPAPYAGCKKLHTDSLFRFTSCFYFLTLICGLQLEKDIIAEIADRVRMGVYINDSPFEVYVEQLREEFEKQKENEKTKRVMKYYLYDLSSCHLMTSEAYRYRHVYSPQGQMK
jgi:hypothetical protein